jgi:histidinol-phosphate aminotransferase
MLRSVDATAMATGMNTPIAKPWIEAISAYTPGKAKSDDGRVLIKLSANENPLGCSAAAAAALVAAVHLFNLFRQGG